MSMPAAKLGDRVVGTDVHVVLVPSSGGPVPTPMSLPFAGTITGGCCAMVLIEGKAAATVQSEATNTPAHVAPSGTFQRQPANRGVVLLGSTTVFAGGKPLARSGDKVLTCNDPSPAPTSAIVATGTVFAG